MTIFTVMTPEPRHAYWLLVSGGTLDYVRKNLSIQQQTGLISNYTEEPWNPLTDLIFSNKPINTSSPEIELS